MLAASGVKSFKVSIPLSLVSFEKCSCTARIHLQLHRYTAPFEVLAAASVKVSIRLITFL